MRIDRVLLARFGHLSDVALEFPDDARLHVVLGANEAGKSTALAAIGDGMFGFKLTSSAHSFLHRPEELRVELSLAKDGERRTFTRLKRREGLRDEAGEKLPEAEIERFRGTGTRDAFREMFGLSGEKLREGGQQILDGKGDIGAVLFQASSGLHGVPAAAARLKKQADLLFKGGYQDRQFTLATKRYREAARELGAKSLRSDEFLAVQRQHDERKQAVTALAERRRALEAERTRLGRIWRTAKPSRERAETLAQLAALGPVPSLPNDAEARRLEALWKRQVSAAVLDRASQEHAERARLRDALVPDAALLQEADAIAALAGDVSRIDIALRDRETLRQEAQAHARTIEQHARALGVPGDAASILARQPTDLARRALRDASRALERLDASLVAERNAAAEADSQLEQADTRLAALPACEDPSALRLAIEAVRQEGPLDTQLAELASRLDAAIQQAGGSLAALPSWNGGIGALKAVHAPLAATIRAHGKRLASCAEALHDRARDVARARETLAEDDTRLTGSAIDGPLPTEAMLHAERDRRDRAWRLVRRHFVEGGPAAAAEELEDLGAPDTAGLPELLERWTAASDRLADRLAREAGPLARHAQALQTRAEHASELTRAERLLDMSQKAADAAQQAWEAEWAGTGIVPGAPDAMTEWLAQRAAVIAAHVGEDDARMALERVDQTRRSARERLAGYSSGRAIGPALDAAEAACAGAERQIQLLRAATEARDASTIAAKTAHARLQRAETSLANARMQWPTLVQPFGLPATAGLGEAEVARDRWDEIGKTAQAFEAARERIDEMTADIDAFEQAASRLVLRAGPALAGKPAREAAFALSAALDSARREAHERSGHDDELVRLAHQITTAREAHDEAATAMRVLCDLARVADEAGLPDAIERASRHQALTRMLHATESALQTQAAGFDLDALAVEASMEDETTLERRVSDLERGLSELGEAQQQATAELTESRGALDRMRAGRDAAEAGQRVEDAVREAGDIAQRYARLRLASDLLLAGLSRFRQEQQAPLLRRAGKHFQTLTRGRYERLEVDEDDAGRASITAVLSGGGRCPVPALSEGARDQLYLALRVAAIEAHAATADPMPFIADDLLVHFDDARARAGLELLAELGAVTQTILFTHHEHIAAMVTPDLGKVHHLPAP